MTEAGKTLVIVESPTKAQTLRRFLGAGYVVASSVGHVRDLPASAAEIPPKLKGEPWARLGVNVEKDFEALYVVQPAKRKTIADLRQKLATADRLLLATDEDREGEAISWHLLELLKPKVPVGRMVFHEITKPAILRALGETRELDDDLVDAQEARRIIDRLFGYEVSPILWKKIAPRLSAGRVQSVATLILVERERARMRFRPAEYWDLSAILVTAPGPFFEAALAALGGARVASGNDFDPDTGRPKNGNAVVLGREEAGAIAAELEGRALRIVANEEKPFVRRPAPPFTTSTLQQEGNRQLRFSARRTMKAAQRLYETGYITYMRTDSTALSGEAIRMTQAAIVHTYGPDYLPEKPRFYATKVKNAQEAHEAIRPAGDRVAPIGEVAAKLGGDEARVYELIWKRTLACQMKDATGRRRTIRAAATLDDGREAVFVANGNSIDFPGFLRAYVEGSDDPEAALAERETILPPVAEGETVTAAEVRPEGHSTAPPPRLTEATLVKALEESGIGRPSTYASIIDTIERREYVFKKGTALVPTFTAFAVVSLMEQHFAALIDPGFTAKMEDRLDAIARGELERLPYLREFYFGDGTPGLRQVLDRKIADIDARQVCSFPLAEDPECVVRVGRFGTYVQRGEATAPLPPETCPDEVDAAVVSRLLAEAGRAQEPLGIHEETGENIYLKRGRFGPYLKLGDEVKGSRKKPKMVSLLPGMDPATLDLGTARRLLSLPRSLGKDPEGREVFACTGRYGPYVKRDGENASLRAGDDVLTIGLPRALELFALKGRRGKKAKEAEPIRVFAAVQALGGADVKVLDGRYGPYVTDGKVNATLPKGTDPGAVTVEVAVELLLARAAKGPAKRPRRRKAR